MRTHTGDQSFTSSSNLKQHQYKHSGEKPYSCLYCEKQFAHSAHLKDHEQTHTKEKPYACDQCEKQFTLTSSHWGETLQLPRVW